jgi:hypothetical protein
MAQSTIEDQAAPDETFHGRSLLFSGCVAGLAGGVAMAAYLVFAAAVQGMEPLTALEPMGATFRDAVEPSAGDGSMLFGLFLHLAVSAMAGLLFVSVLPRNFSPGNAAFICVGFAFAMMGVMTSCIVPAANPVLKESFHDLGGSWVIAHALFGFTVGYACQKLRQPRMVRAGRRLQQRVA